MIRERLLQRYERHLSQLGLSVVTRKMYLKAAERFLARPGMRNRSQFTRADLERYLAGRRPAISRSSQVTELYHLRPFFRALIALGLTNVDPSEQLKGARIAAAKQLLLSEAKVERILTVARRTPRRTRGEAVGLRNRAALELAYGLGLRVGELVAIRMVDLDRGAGTLLVRRGKGGRQQVLPLPPSTLRSVGEYLRHGRPALLARGRRRDRGALLLNNQGGPLTVQVMTIHARAISKRAGVWFHMHALRRALATHLARRGVSLPVIRDLLGHASLDTTQVYLGATTEDLRETVAQLDRSRGSRR